MSDQSTPRYSSSTLTNLNNGPTSPPGFADKINSPQVAGNQRHSFEAGSSSSTAASSSSSSYLVPSIQFSEPSPVNYPSIPPMPASASALGLGRSAEFYPSGPVSARPYPKQAAKPAMDSHYRQLEVAERMLDDMRHAQLDAAFTEELRAIEEWFKVLNDVERSSSLYALLQYMTPIQIRFFATILNSMARRADPAALFSSGFNDPVDVRHSSAFGGMDMYSGSQYGMDLKHDQARQYYQGSNSIQSARYADHDRYMDGPRSAFLTSRTHDGNTGSNGGWQSVPGSALLAPPGFGSLSQDGPPATPFAEHPSVMQQAMESGNPSARTRTSLDGKDPHPSYTAPSWRSISRPSSPALPAKRETMITSTSPGLRSPTMHTPSASASFSGTGSESFDQVRGARNNGGASASFSGNVSRPIPIKRPGSAHAHRNPSNTVSSQNNSHRRADSQGNCWGSVPTSPAASRDSNGGLSGSSGSSGSTSGGSGKNPEFVDVDLLKTDIPGWLRSLRLHKYTPVLENVRWDKLISLNDSELLALGVSAQGARSKFLKVFAQVNAQLNITIAAPNLGDIVGESALATPSHVLLEATANSNPISA